MRNGIAVGSWGINVSMWQEVVVHRNEVVVVFRKLNHTTNPGGSDTIVRAARRVLIVPVNAAGANGHCRKALPDDFAVVEAVLPVVHAGGRLTIAADAHFPILRVDELVVARDIQVQILAVD